MMRVWPMYVKIKLASIICSDTDAGHLGHFRQGQKLDYMCEQMASVMSLDTVNLPTISAHTKMSLPKVSSPIRTRHS